MQLVWRERSSEDVLGWHPCPQGSKTCELSFWIEKESDGAFVESSERLCEVFVSSCVGVQPSYACSIRGREATRVCDGAGPVYRLEYKPQGGLIPGSQLKFAIRVSAERLYVASAGVLSTTDEEIAADDSAGSIGKICDPGSQLNDVRLFVDKLSRDNLTSSRGGETGTDLKQQLLLSIVNSVVSRGPKTSQKDHVNSSTTRGSASVGDHDISELVQIAADMRSLQAQQYENLCKRIDRLEKTCLDVCKAVQELQLEVRSRTNASEARLK